MTPRVPTADEQIAFLADVQLLLDEGQFAASYTFPLLIALADLAIESEVYDGRELEIPIEKIAEKFVAYYWRQAAPWSPAGRAGDSVVLRQNAGKQAEVITRVFEVRERVSAYEVDVRRNSREWRSLISKVKHVVAVMPLWKLQTLKGRKLEFLYVSAGRSTTSCRGAGIRSILPTTSSWRMPAVIRARATCWPTSLSSIGDFGATRTRRTSWQRASPPVTCPSISTLRGR